MSSRRSGGGSRSSTGSSDRAPPRAAAAANIFDSSDDDDVMPRPARAASRVSGRGARGGPRPANRGGTAAAAARGRPAAAAAARGGAAGRAAARRGRDAAAAARGNRGPIFGGRQNQLVRRGQANIERLIAGAGRAYRVGRPREEDENAGGDLDDTIVLSDEEDSASEGDDVEMSDEEDEEDLEQLDYDLEDSFINDESILEGFENPFMHDSFDDDDEEGWEDALDLNPNGRRVPNEAEETFSQEVEEFELMEERENQAARRAEERRRKKEDKEEKENKDALRTDMFGACTVCAEDEVTDPVGCIHCANFIGCRKCVNRWYRTSKGNDPQKIASCPLCRHQWTSSMPEVGDMLDLVKPA